MAEDRVSSPELDESWTEIASPGAEHGDDEMGVSESMYPVRYNPSSTMLPDEEVVCRDYAEIRRADSFLSGTVFLTNYRLLFVEFSQHGRRGTSLATPICTVATVEESQEGNPDLRLLIISLKQLLTLRMRVPPKLAFHRLLELGSGVARDPPRLAVAWADRPHWRRELQHHAKLRHRARAIPHSWLAFDAVTEYTRVGLLGGLEPSPWRLTDTNADYTLSDSYPDQLVVPAATDDAQLRRVASFRARGRVPCATYRHPNGATILRSSQPLVGLMRARSAADEAHLQAVCNTVAGNGGAKLHIVDCRAQTSAYANFAIGAGFETQAHYGCAELQFMNIDNIHAMRNSLHRLVSVCQESADSTTWLSALEGSRWLEHVGSVLRAACVVAKIIHHRACPVLVHCSDGWDRTPQVAALAQLLLDPYYRTIEGFEVLVEKDWCAFGHKFADRCAHRGTSFWEHEQSSPVFLQFVDAVWQLTHMFPTKFEFNSAYLIALLDEIYACRTGTFLHNRQSARKAARAASTTVSVWHALLALRPREAYLNPYYDPVSPSSAAAARLPPCTARGVRRRMHLPRGAQPPVWDPPAPSGAGRRPRCNSHTGSAALTARAEAAGRGSLADRPGLPRWATRDQGCDPDGEDERAALYRVAGHRERAPPPGSPAAGFPAVEFPAGGSLVPNGAAADPGLRPGPVDGARPAAVAQASEAREQAVREAANRLAAATGGAQSALSRTLDLGAWVPHGRSRGARVLSQLAQLGGWMTGSMIGRGRRGVGRAVSVPWPGERAEGPDGARPGDRASCGGPRTIGERTAAAVQGSAGHRRRHTRGPSLGDADDMVLLQQPLEWQGPAEDCVDAGGDVLLPDHRLPNLSLWVEYYMRFAPEDGGQGRGHRGGAGGAERVAARLRAENEELQRRLRALERAAGGTGGAEGSTPTDAEFYDVGNEEEEEVVVEERGDQVVIHLAEGEGEAGAGAAPATSSAMCSSASGGLGGPWKQPRLVDGYFRR